MTRKQERLVYWILIATLAFTMMGMMKVEQIELDQSKGGATLMQTDHSRQSTAALKKSAGDGLGESFSSSTEQPIQKGKLGELTNHKEDEIDPDCHLPSPDGYYDGDGDGYYYGYGYGYEESTEDESSEKNGNTDDEKIFLGPCSYVYPKNIKPKEGYLHGIDFFHFRNNTARLETCFLKCIDLVDSGEVNNQWLIISSSMGLAKLSQKIMTKFDLDPVSQTDDLNAVQVAIRGGHARTVKALTSANNNMVIDEHGRTVADYVGMKGSPIRPIDAKHILGLIIDNESTAGNEENRMHTQVNGNNLVGNDKNNSGWNTETSYSYDETCDIDVIDYNIPRSTFFKEYYSTGRPFVLRNHVPKEELAAFSKHRWDIKRGYNTDARHWNVGPTAYPSRTGQKYCSRKFTIKEIENSTRCSEMPDIPMVTAWHPSDDDFGKLYPMYTDKEFYKLSGWRNIEDWFGSVLEADKHMSWQVFLGGDESGATLHWHLAALNTLYVGTKAWRLTPPLYRGWTGMPARKAAEILDEGYDAITVRCTQHAGDLIYVPEHWGHLTLNHGFTIGAAVILPAKYHKYNQGLQTSDTESKRTVKIPAAQVHQPKKVPFMFVHINKTGGSSIIRMLNSRCRNEYLSEKWGVKHRTFHATALSHIDHFGRKTWDEAYTFAIVRHPLARQVSNFFFLASMCKKNKGMCEERNIPKEVRGEKMESLTDEEKIKAFHQWVRSLYKTYPPGSENEYLFGSIGHGNEEMLSFNSTQTSWLVDEKGKIVLDDIFHLENLSKNMTKLAESIPCLKNQDNTNELDKDPILRMLKEKETLVDMIHENAAPRYPDYKLFTKSRRTQQIMKEYYAVDYENFGYTM